MKKGIKNAFELTFELKWLKASLLDFYSRFDRSNIFNTKMASKCFYLFVLRIK